MYAIVKTGGKQYRVAEGDVIEVEKLVGAPGDAVSLAAVLLVDGENLVTDAAAAGRRRGDRRGRGPHQGPQDPDSQVQEQDRLPQAPGSPPAADPGQGNRHLEREVGAPWLTKRVRPALATVATRPRSGSA